MFFLLLAAPLFVQKTAQLPQGCSGFDPGCYTNYVVIADVDGDGKLDVILPSARGYYVKQSPAEPLRILKNDGSANFTDISGASVGGFTGWLREVALGDIDGDGSLDIAAPDAWGADAALFVNDGSGNFIDKASTQWSAATRAGSVRFADVDDDGDLDLFVGDWGADPDPANPAASSLHLWLNDGSGSFTAADGQLPANPFPATSKTPIDLDVIDANGDFSPDLLIDARNGDLLLYLNDGAGHFTSAPFPTKPGPYSYNPGVCDVDGDDDLDIWVDNAINAGDPQLLINAGDGTFTDETSARVSGAAGYDDNGVVCADLDGDGDFDAVIMSLGPASNYAENERELINDGTGHFTPSTDAFPLVNDPTLGMDFGDLNGDHKLDAVTGQGEGADFTDRLYLGTNGAVADTRAPHFRAESVTTATVGSAATPVVHFAISDNVTTDVGPRLSDVHVEWTGSGAVQNVAPRFMGGDLFRAVLPARGTPGSVSWKTCATDLAGNAGCGATHTYTASGTGPNPPGGDKKKGCSCALDGGASASPLALVCAGLAFLLQRRKRASTKEFGEL